MIYECGFVEDVITIINRKSFTFLANIRLRFKHPYSNPYIRPSQPDVLAMTHFKAGIECEL